MPAPEKTVPTTNTIQKKRKTKSSKSLGIPFAPLRGIEERCLVLGQFNAMRGFSQINSTNALCYALFVVTQEYTHVM
eukprot:2534558-Amphidinium_carterae.1